MGRREAGRGNAVHLRSNPSPSAQHLRKRYLAASYSYLHAPLPLLTRVNWTACELGKEGRRPRLCSCCVVQLDHTHTEGTMQAGSSVLCGGSMCMRPAGSAKEVCVGRLCLGKRRPGEGGWDMEAMLPSLFPNQLTAERQDDYGCGSTSVTSTCSTFSFLSILWFARLCGLLGCRPDSSWWSGRGKRKGRARVLPSHAAISESDGKMDVQSVVRFQDLVLSQASGGGRWRRGEASGSSPFWESRDGSKGGEMRRPQGQPHASCTVTD